VYPNANRLDEFDVVDLQTVSDWRLRLSCAASTSRGYQGAYADLRIKRLSITSRLDDDCIVGRVVEEISGWPVKDAVIKDASGRPVARTLASGDFLLTRRPVSAITVEKADYAPSGTRSLAAEQVNSIVEVRLRKLKLAFGDVVGVISYGNLRLQAIGFREGSLWAFENDPDSGGRLLQVNTSQMELDTSGPKIAVRTGLLQSFAECEGRLIGLDRWRGVNKNGVVFDLNTDSPRAVLELTRPHDAQPLCWPSGCAFDGQSLWFIEADATHDRYGLHAFDLARLEIRHSLPTIDQGIRGLAWDGQQFWVSSAEGRVYAVDRNAALRLGSVDLGIGRGFSGDYLCLAFGQGHLWGLEPGNHRICKIKITD
jgi:hypothetical protein